MDEAERPFRAPIPRHHAVRRLFLAAGIIMLLTLPLFYSAFAQEDKIVSVMGILILGFLAGFTSPKQRWVIVADTIVSGLGLLVFEYYAVGAKLPFSPGTRTIFFIINQTLAIIFLFALYYSARTWRKDLLGTKNR